MNKLKPEDVMRAKDRCVDCLHYDACEDWAKNWGIKTRFPYEDERGNLCDQFQPQNLLREKDALIAKYILQIAEMQKQIATQDRILTDFMKRKQIEADKDAEIERLKEENDGLSAELEAEEKDFQTLTKMYKTARSEAINEFAARLITYYNALKSGLVAYHIEQVKAELLGGAK